MSDWDAEAYKARIEQLEKTLKTIRDFPYTGRQAEQQMRRLAGGGLEPRQECLFGNAQ